MAIVGLRERGGDDGEEIEGMRRVFMKKLERQRGDSGGDEGILEGG